MVMMIINIFNIFMLEMQITLKGWKHWGVVRKSRVWNLPRWDLKKKWIVPLGKRGKPDCEPRGMARVHRTDVDGRGYLPGVTRLPPPGWQELPPMQGASPETGRMWCGTLCGEVCDGEASSWDLIGWVQRQEYFITFTLIITHFLVSRWVWGGHLLAMTL